MHLYPTKTTRRLGTRLYRRMRYRKGHGVHSPFVFNLITKVIEESLPFYRFNEIEQFRSELLKQCEFISYTEQKGEKEKQRINTIAKITKREAISQKQGMLLFRLANYFKCKRVIQLGTGVGISSLYLASYDSSMQCISIESTPAFASIAQNIQDKALNQVLDFRIGAYSEMLSQALEEMKQVDMVYFKCKEEQQQLLALFEQAMQYRHDETLFVFDGIKASKQMRQVWKEVCKHPSVTVTVDLYSMGLVFFNPKLHKRDYINYF